MTPILPEPRFYVYILLRPDASVFYVGKGQRRRVRDHENEARRGHRCHKCYTIRRIWAEGGQIEKQVIFRTDVEADALAFEQATIAHYGKDALCNQTDGGEGLVGYTFSAEHRAKIGAKHKGRVHSAEARAKMSEARRATIARKRAERPPRPDKLTREQISRAVAESNRRRVWTEEQRERQRIGSSGRPHTDKARAKVAASKYHLTLDQAREIRALRAGGMLRQELATRFGVSLPTIDRILSGRTYPDE